VGYLTYSGDTVSAWVALMDREAQLHDDAEGGVDLGVQEYHIAFQEQKLTWHEGQQQRS
jgi:hypothetical protein